MGMDSIIYLKEKVENKERKFGSVLTYYPCTIEFGNGEKEKALFTKNQIEVALERGLDNPEDFPKKKSFWSKLFW